MWSKDASFSFPLLATYEKARKKLHQAEYTSDLHSEEELGRGKLKKSRVQLLVTSDSDSGSDKLYEPPKPPTPPLRLPQRKKGKIIHSSRYDSCMCV